MKRLLLFFSFLLIVTVVLAERSGFLWSYEAPLLRSLETVTGRSLPAVTAIKLPVEKDTLVAQDVALTLRAIATFHPKAILVTEPLGDLSKGPLSLVKESLEQGKLQGVPVLFATSVENKAAYRCSAADLFVFPEEKEIMKIDAAIDPNVPIGFVLPDKDGVQMPLIALAGDHFAASLWWRALMLNQHEQKGVPLLFFGRLLEFPNHSTLLLNEDAGLVLASHTTKKSLMLDDLLLHREEMERGAIRPDLDLLFHDKIVLIGGQEVTLQAATLEQAEQQTSVRRLSTTLYALLLLIMMYAFMKVFRLAWIDFLLILVFFFLIYGGIGFFLYRAQGILLPFFLPLITMFVAIIKKWDQSSNF